MPSAMIETSFFLLMEATSLYIPPRKLGTFGAVFYRSAGGILYRAAVMMGRDKVSGAEIMTIKIDKIDQNEIPVGGKWIDVSKDDTEITSIRKNVGGYLVDELIEIRFVSNENIVKFSRERDEWGEWALKMT